MLVVGLTGGIGSGKSSFAALLAERGAQIIDADELGRDALRPGEPAWHKVVSQFGDEVLAANSLDVDRKRLAAIVFNDANKLAALNAIVHPIIFDGIAGALDSLRHTNEIVVLDAALVFETGLDRATDVIIAVLSQEPERARRLRATRGMSSVDIKARMTAQMDSQELTRRADIIVRNDSTLDDLARQADEAFGELEARRDATS